jgi:hypothetical protein
MFAVISMGGFMFSHSLGIDDEIAQLFFKENSLARAPTAVIQSQDSSQAPVSLLVS